MIFWQPGTFKVPQPNSNDKSEYPTTGLHCIEIEQTVSKGAAQAQLHIVAIGWSMKGQNIKAL
jgi:hypothetical protein